MLSFQKAEEKVLKAAKRLESEIITITEAAGRILAEDIKSDIDIPPFNKSAMDGYALKYNELKKYPAGFEISECIKAGSYPRKAIKYGECVKIMTGSILPAGADTVVMVENTRESRGKVIVKKPVLKGGNICFKGEDIRRRELLFKKGIVLTEPVISALSAVGKSKVSVFKRPELALIATGDELVDMAVTPQLGKIRNSNTPMLISALRLTGIAAYDLGIARDTKRSLNAKIKKGLSKDIVVLSGGVSMGEYDLVPAVLKDLGVKKIFHKVFVKPGKPLYFGKYNDRLIFGLPGNPVSVFTNFIFFIKPVIRKMMGVMPPFVEILRGVMDEDFIKNGKRTTLYPIKLKFEGISYHLKPVEYHGSADIKGVCGADGFMIIEGNKNIVKKGEIADFVIF